MPIIGETVNLEYKLLPLTLNADGSSIVYLRKGFTVNGEFVVFESIEAAFTPTETQTVLMQMPISGKNRRDDFSDAMYELLVSKGYAAGTIS